ncbi:MAG TPA: SDR family oxidoreductase [Gemmatimonadaceae bacterium]|nr:SDR family oxidoreductase [Gemmatimonadaceae bacterium]
MKVKLKRVGDQVMVITGASSGIGLSTAKAAARRGAKVVLVSRDEADLTRAAEEIRATGGTALVHVADVADAAAMRYLAERVVTELGGIDSWVNNAGVSIYGRVEEVSLDDARRLFETNYWGVVNGSLAAIPHLRSSGGALINVGSIASDTAIPLQGHYSASKHAVKGFTDALRLELEREGAPIAVTLVRPASIDTPYPHHAKNYLEMEPKQLAPVYAPEVVADVILACAERPRRAVYAGGAAKVISSMESWAPRAVERYKEARFFDRQRSDEPSRHHDILYGPRAGDGRERGDYPGRTRRSSALTSASLHRGRTALGIAALGAGLAYAASRRER